MVKPGMFISDRYEIIDKIGAGGMADVYKAKCHRLNRFVAIKILKSEYSEDKKFVDKFRAEAQSAAGLSHPNIVNVYDVGEDEDLHYIVMELIEGITLKTFIERKGHLEAKEATGIAIQIARGMEAAHHNHIIHRDIKPQNIIISKEGKVKVTDFGIAKATTSNTITSNAMGSVYYISPEQARGGYSDEKSDIYSLGVTLYEMLTGQVPFSGENTVSVALAHIQEEPANVRTLNPEISASLDRIVQKCMQKKAERRYGSAEELIEDLKKSINNPTGDFVRLTGAMVDDSPTISLSEREVNTIRTASGKKAVEEEPEEEVFEEPEEEGEMDPKLEKLMIGGGIAAAIILVLVIGFLIGQFIGIFGGGKESTEDEKDPVDIEEEQQEDNEENEEESEVTMLYVIGYTKEEANEAMLELGLKPEYKEEPSNNYEANLVCGQEPERGTKLKKGDTVVLTVSTGPDNTAVPFVGGKSRADVEAAFSEAGITVGSYEEEYSDTVPAGSVTRTVPSEGTSVAKNTSVVVYISKGKETKLATVPNLFNLFEDAALEALTDAKLKGKVSAYKYSDTVEKGKVIDQSHSYGTQVEEGTEITFTVSLGPEATYAYFGSITISDNPFMYEDEEGTISLVLTQDGKSWEVYNEVCTYDDFPLTIPDIEGRSDSVGEITMYCDNAKIGTYSISFKAVKQ